MGQILVCIGGVYHQQVPVFFKAVQIRIVHGASVRSGDDAILGTANCQSLHIAGKHLLQECYPVRAFNDQAAHVGHVEDPAIPAGIQMLGHNATGVLDGHFPSAKVHHGGACRYMGVM